jgi:hypothetical protein
MVQRHVAPASVKAGIAGMEDLETVRIIRSENPFRPMVPMTLLMGSISTRLIT